MKYNGTIFWLTWLILIAAFVIANYIIIEKKNKRPGYLQQNIAKMALAVPHGILMLPQDVDFSSLTGWQLLWIWIPIVAFQFTSFWILFDLSLNIWRGKHPLYIGPNSGWIDRIGFKNRGPYYFAKGCALVILVLSIINLYFRG